MLYTKSVKAWDIRITAVWNGLNKRMAFLEYRDGAIIPIYDSISKAWSHAMSEQYSSRLSRFAATYSDHKLLTRA